MKKEKIDTKDVSKSTLAIKPNFTSIAEKAAVGAFVSSHYKANKKYLKTFLEGILGGFFVSIGFVVALYASSSLDGAAKTILISAIFPIGILLVTFVGGSLYTTNCVGFINACTKDVKYKTFFTNLVISYLANIVGAAMVFAILLLMGMIVPYVQSGYKLSYSDNGSFASAVASFSFKKLGSFGTQLGLGAEKTITAGAIAATFFSNVFSGIVCNVFVCVTLYITFSTKNIAAIFFMIWLSIFVFVASGTQHSVANLIVLFCNFAQSLVVSTGLDSNTVTSIEVGHHIPSMMPLYFLTLNLIPSIIGNFLGGGILIPGIVYFIYKDKLQQASKDLVLEKSSELIDDLTSKIHASVTL